MNLAEYLTAKHLEYCNQAGRIVNESEWVKDVLNQTLPSNDKLSYASVNQWMNNDRTPDAKNIIRLVSVFGPEIMPYVGINIEPDLMKLIRDWDYLPLEAKQQIAEIIQEHKDNAVTVRA